MATASAVTWNDENISATATWFVEDLEDEFELSDEISIPVDRYSFMQAEFSFQTSETKPGNVTHKLTLGRFFDGVRFGVSATPKWNVSKLLELSAVYQYDRISFSGRDQTFEAHTMRLKVGLTLNTSLSMSSFFQYNSSADFALGNFRLRYNPKEGNDFYLVFNEGLNTDRYRYSPVPPVVDSRALIVKYSYTFVK